MTARYVWLTNVRTPGDGLFSVSGFRLFSDGLDKAPTRVKGVEVVRNVSDPRQVCVAWEPAKGADFYIIRYAIASDRLFKIPSILSLRLSGHSPKDVGQCLRVKELLKSGLKRDGIVSFCFSQVHGG